MYTILSKSAFFVICFMLTLISILSTIEALAFVDLPYVNVIQKFSYESQIQELIEDSNISKKTAGVFDLNTKELSVERLDVFLRVLELPPEKERLYTRDNHLQVYRNGEDIYPNILYTNDNWRSFSRIQDLRVQDEVSIVDQSESDTYQVNALYKSTRNFASPVTSQENGVYLFVELIEKKELIVVELIPS